MPYLLRCCAERRGVGDGERLDTVIGSSGTRLSGGQAQRLALPGRWPIHALSSSSTTRSRPSTGTRRIRSLPTCRNTPRIRSSFSSRTACTTSRRCRRSSLWMAERPLSAPMRSFWRRPRSTASCTKARQEGNGMENRRKNGVSEAIRMAAVTHRLLTAGTVLCAAASVVASLVPPLLLARIIDGLTAGLPLTFLRCFFISAVWRWKGCSPRRRRACWYSSARK